MKKSKIVEFKDERYPVEDLYTPEDFKPSCLKHFKFMEAARVISQKSDFLNFNLGAVIVKDGKIIARGFNTNKSHPEQMINNTLKDKMNRGLPLHPTHAEKLAINKVLSRLYKIRENSKYTSIQDYLSDASMYIYRVGRNGNSLMARPCKGCMQEIVDVGIKTIHYSTPAGYAMEKLTKLEIKPRKRKFY